MTFDQIVFVYSREGVVKCLYADEARIKEHDLLAAGWHHTATINPTRWIECLCNNGGDPSDMLDELQFKPKKPVANQNH